jgi:hypothetical protein
MLKIRFWKFGFKANALNIPPGEYGRKIKTQQIWRNLDQRWSMWFNSMVREKFYQFLYISCFKILDKNIYV